MKAQIQQRRHALVGTALLLTSIFMFFHAHHLFSGTHNYERIQQQLVTEVANQCAGAIKRAGFSPTTEQGGVRIIASGGEFADTESEAARVSSVLGYCAGYRVREICIGEQCRNSKRIELHRDF